MRPDNLHLYHASRTPRTSGHVRTSATSGPAYVRRANPWRVVLWLAAVGLLLAAVKS